MSHLPFLHKVTDYFSVFLITDTIFVLHETGRSDFNINNINIKYERGVTHFVIQRVKIFQKDYYYEFDSGLNFSSIQGNRFFFSLNFCILVRLFFFIVCFNQSSLLYIDLSKSCDRVPSGIYRTPVFSSMQFHLFRRTWNGYSHYDLSINVQLTRQNGRLRLN